MKGMCLGLLLLFGLLALQASAQVHKTAVGISGSVDLYSFDEEHVEQTRELVEKSGYSAGIKVHQFLSSHWVLVGALYYSDRSYSVRHHYQFNTSGDPHIPRRAEFSLQYLDAQALVGYRFNTSSRITFGPAIGWAVNYSLKEHVRVVYENNGVFQADLHGKEHSRFHSLKAEFPVEYQLSEKFKMALAPYFRYRLTKPDDLYMQPKAGSAGAALELYYTF